jgi:hypothetical protein
MRLGGKDAYRGLARHALLGTVQTEALPVDAIPISPEARAAAFE